MVDKLGILLVLLRLVSISLELISISRWVLVQSLVVLLVLTRLLAAAVALAQKVLCQV